MSLENDFITKFLTLTEGAVSPEIFRLWSAISLCAGACSRRVSAKTGKGHVYPNLYVLLVGPPGSGKSIIETAKELWSAARSPDSKGPAFSVASDSVSSASMVDELAKGKYIKIMPSGPPFVHHSLIIAAEELQVLLPGYDTQVIGKLNSLYNNAGGYSESRRTGSVKDLQIENPCLNILAGVQPAYFASTFPEEVWSTGFARRVIMIYSDAHIVQSLWYEPEVDDQLRPWICQRLTHMAAQHGVCKWTPEAADLLDKWHMSGGAPVPQHSKLAQYLRQRSVNAIKLAVISCISRNSPFVIEACDIERAIRWMTEAEIFMPDIFRAMIGKSDSQVIEECHYFIAALFQKNKRQPVSGGPILRFLLHRVPTDKAEKILKMMEMSNIIARVAGTADLYIPRPKHEHEGEDG